MPLIPLSPQKLTSSPSLNKNDSTRTLSPAISRSSSQLDLKLVYDDPFHFENLLKHINFSSFNIILEGSVDSSCNSFPYYSRVIKKFIKIKPIYKIIKVNAPKGISECKCLTNKSIQKNNSVLKIPSILISRKFAPSLSCILKIPQSPKYPSHLIILNFEGALGSYAKAELYIKPGILTSIKKLSSYFKVVLVTATNIVKTSVILEYFVELKIGLSGVYTRNEVQNTNKELNKLQDYSLIYTDYNITNPEQEVLIIASHRYLDDIEEMNEEIISIKAGTTIKLNVERSPISSKEYPNSPLTILLPNFQMNKSPQILNKITNITSFLDELENTNDKLNFRKILENMKFSLIKSTAIHAVIAEHMQIRKKIFNKSIDPGKQLSSKKINYCELHGKYSCQHSCKLAYNLFVLF